MPNYVPLLFLRWSEVDKLRAIMAVAVLGSTQAHVALAQDSPDIPLTIRTLMVLCVGGPTTKITVEADTSSRRTVRRNCEHGGGSFDYTRSESGASK